MQLSKVLLVIGTTSVSLIPLAGRAADKAPVAPLVAPTPAAPDAVEKARAAMRQKLDELQAGAPATPAPTPAAPVKIIPPPAPAAAPATPPPAPTPAPAPAPTVAPDAPPEAIIPTADPSAIAKAREALESKMSELSSQPEQASAPAPQLTKQQKKEQAEAMRKAQQAAKREAAVQGKAPKSQANFAETGIAPATMTKEAQPEAPKRHTAAPEMASKPTKASHAALSFEPLSGPPSPLSAEKQQRLSELLSKYKADQITPEQYHQERAHILAEP